MKHAVGLGLLCAALLGNEIERIESIVNDVTALRADYDTCQTRLKALEDEKKSLSAETVRDYEARIKTLEEALADAREEERTAKRSLEHATTQILQLNQLVSEQKQHIATLNTDQSAKVVTRTVNIPAQCPEVNPFPKLMMKSETLRQAENKKAPAETTQTVTVTSRDELIYFKPSAFRVTADTEIYDAPGGNVIDRWEAMTSFTSNRKRNGWIRITGYFIDKQWRPSNEKEMWVREAVTLKR